MLIGRGAGKDGYIGFQSFCLASPYNPAKRYDVDICANSEVQAKAPVDDILAVLEHPPNNKKLLSMRPEGFGCPSDGNAYMYDATCTSYLAVIGPGTAWSQLVEGRSVDSDSDEEDKSILLVETTDANIGWTEPRDLNLNELNSPDSPQISSKHMRNNGFFYHESPRGAHVTLGDGIVWLLPAEAIKSDKLIDLLAAGGYNKKIISSIDTSETLRIHWPHCVAFAVWLVSLVLLLHWAVRCGGRTKNPSDQADRVGPHQLV